MSFGEDRTSRQIRSKKRIKVITQKPQELADGGKKIEAEDSLQSRLKTISGEPVMSLTLAKQEVTNVILIFDL